ncbi:outer membrane protein assembly factor BamB family protein [Dactylosporangium darangshiense]|uniref:Pyrrolo-quinoline quinone repeat domain-containing protein n=1 Tax=Dactylosporangium darangshiense TaxID=579108 RepID=A0ABP8D3T0_9ACTN
MSELIDLGESHGRLDGDDVLEWPASRPAGGRQWPLVAVLTLVVLFATGSRPQAGIDDLGVLADRASAFVADRGALYALRESPSLTAFDWATGRTMWSRSTPGGSGQVYLAADRAYLRHRPCTQTVGWSLERLDPATGQARWNRSGAPIAVVAGPPGAPPGLLTVDDRGAVCPPVVPPRNAVPSPVHLAGLDAETGEIRWAFDLPGGARLVAPDSPGGAWFAVWYPGGRAEIRSTLTGAVNVAADLDELAGTPPTSVRIVGDLLVIVAARTDGALITAYHRDGLRYRWHRLFSSTDQAPIAEIAYGPVVVACGPMVCVPNWRDLAVLDPVTGEQAWRRPLQLDAAGPGVLVARDRDDFTHVRIVDWHTGADRADLAGWAIVPTASTGTDDDDLGTAQVPAAILQRPDGDGSRLVRIDLRTGAVTSLGRVAPIPARCSVRHQRLSCLAGGDTVHLWRLPG